MTTAAAIIFMLTSLSLWILSGRETTSVVGGEKAPAATTVPAAKPDDKAAATAPATKPEQKPEQKPAEKPAVPAPVEKK